MTDIYSDDLYDRFTFRHSDSGKEVTRVKRVYAENPWSAAALLPQFGESIDISTASGQPYYVYVADVDVDPVSGGAATASGFLFEGTITYRPIKFGNRTTPVLNKATFRVAFEDTQILVRHVDSASDAAHYGADGSGDAGYQGTGVNVTDEGPQGTEINEKVEILSIQFWKDPDVVDTYLDSIRGIKDTVNQSAFEGPWGTYAAGEARIESFELAHLGEDLDEVTVRIKRRPNRTGDDSLSVWIDKIAQSVSIPKKGWQYVWKREGSYVDPENDEKKQEGVLDAHRNTFYPDGDWSVLGITEGIWT